MPPSLQLTWALLLAGAALSSLRMSRGWVVRPDPTAALAAGGLACLACVLVAAAAPS